MEPTNPNQGNPSDPAGMPQQAPAADQGMGGGMPTPGGMPGQEPQTPPAEPTMPIPEPTPAPEQPGMGAPEPAPMANPEGETSGGNPGGTPPAV